MIESTLEEYPEEYVVSSLKSNQAKATILKYESGFTIIELMVVVVIIAVLSGFAIQSYKQESYRNLVKGEAFQIDTFLNAANMYVKKTAASASIEVTSSGMYLRDAAGCTGNIVQSNDWDAQIVLSTQPLTVSSTGLASDVPLIASSAFLGNWTSCILMEPQVGNTITESGGIIVTHSNLTGSEAYEYAVVKEIGFIGFRKYGRIAGSNWELRK